MGDRDKREFRIGEEQAERLAMKFAALPVQVRAVLDLGLACADADIVSSATMAREPLLQGTWIRSGTHVDLIGAYKADMREADDDLISTGSLFVDCRDTTIGHIGEIDSPISRGVITEGSVRGDLYDLIAGRVVGRSSDNEITIFKNGGGAHLDLMVGRYLSSIGSL